MVFSDLDSPAGATGLKEIGIAQDIFNAARRRIDGTIVWSRLDQADGIFEGDAVYVGEDSGATILLDDGSVLEIDENSLVIVQKTITIQRGSLRTSTRGIPLVLYGPGGPIQLDPDSQARVVVRPDGSTQVDVTRGHVDIGGDTVAAGHSLVTAPDGTSSTYELALYLADPPDRTRLYYASRSVRVRFSWEELSGGGEYFFELADDPMFSEVRKQHRTTGLSATIEHLRDGLYYWRVRRGDARSVVRTLVVVADAPPVLYRPHPKQEFESGVHPVFVWTEIPGVRAWSLEIRKSVGARRATSRSITGRTWLTQGLSPGAYCARVRADEAERGASPWSVPRCFVVVPKERLRPPTLYDAATEGVDE